MKYYAIVSLFTMIISIRSEAQFTISSPEVVALQDPWGNIRPRVVLNANNDPVVIWTNTSEGNVYCSTKVGAYFNEPQKLNPDGMTLSTFDWSGPEIASSGNRIVAVMKESPEMEGHIFVVISDDGGLNWSDTIRVEDSAPLMSRMPSVALDNLGNPYVSFLRQDMSTFSEWAVARSVDGGQSFLTPVSVSTPFTDAVCDCCPSSIMVTNEKIIVVYRNNEDNLRDIRASVSIDGGINFTTQLDMDEQDWIVQSCPASAPSAFLTGNKLCSAWMSDANTDNRVYFSSYDFTSDIFEGSTELLPSTSTVTQNYPTTAGNDLVKAVVFEKYQTGQRDLVLAYSTVTDGFVAYPIIELTSDISGNQQRPNMIFHEDVFHLVYTDNGNNAVMYLTLAADILNTSIENKLQFSAFPNPTIDGILNLQFNSDADIHRIDVFDLMGRLSLSRIVNGSSKKINLDMSSLSAGVYCIQACSSGKVSEKKVIVKKD